MLKAVWSLAALDLLLWRRMPLAIVSALLPPITMVVLLEVLSIAVTQQPVALVVQAHGPNTDKLAKLIKQDDDAYLLTVTDEKKAKAMLSDQEVAAVITIPADFEMKVSHHRWWQRPREMALVNLELNNVDIDFSDDIRRSVDRSVMRFGYPASAFDDADEEAEAKTQKQSAPLAQPAKAAPTATVSAAKLPQQPADDEEQREAAQPKGHDNPYLIDVDEHDLRQTNVEWMNYQVIPALVLLVLNVSLTGTALLCAQDVERKTAKYLLLTPQSAWTLVAGRLLGGFAAGMIALAPALVVCLSMHIVSPPLSHWPFLLAIFAATALCASGLGAVLGTALSGTRVIAMAACVVATYLFLLGGGFTTISFLPDWLRNLSLLVPTRYAIDGMRQTLFYPDLEGVAFDLFVLCLTAAMMCAVGSLRIRQSWMR